MTTTSILIWTGVVVVAYMAITNRVLSLVHPLRMKMVALGDHLLDQHDLHDEDVRGINLCLDHAYSKAAAWSFAFILPFAVISAIKDKLSGKKNDSISRVPRRLREDMKAFCKLSFFCMSMSSPLAGLIIWAQMLVYAMIMLPVSAIIFDAAKAAADLQARAEMARAHAFRHAA